MAVLETREGLAASAITAVMQRWLFLVSLMLCFFFGEVRAQDLATEHRVKAAFIYNFTEFVAWPADAFKEENSPFIIAVLGRTRLAVSSVNW